jgi:hypothetical protein
MSHPRHCPHGAPLPDNPAVLPDCAECSVAWKRAMTPAPAPAPVRAAYPVQATARSHPAQRASINRHVYLAAYEVYSHVFGPQQALIEGECRGGFGTGELVAFLYARAFPRSEWRTRVDEAFEGMDLK